METVQGVQTSIGALQDTGVGPKDVASLGIALILIVILCIELFVRLRINRDEVRVSAERVKLLKEHESELTKNAGHMAFQIAQSLRENTGWATSALQRARIGPYDNSPFGSRMEHFFDEKRYIARIFSSMLMSRCRYLIETRKKKVYLLIDSGTTTYHLFEHIGRITALAHSDGEAWIAGATRNTEPEGRCSLVVVTNNIPGIVSLMRHGRPNPNYRHSPIAVDSIVVSGAATPTYSAILGRRATDSIKSIISEIRADRNAVIISIVTGNWLRIRATEPHCALPLARGTGHMDFKRELMGPQDDLVPWETYVLSPLGKVFGNAKVDGVNSAIGSDAKSSNPDLLPYEDLDIDSQYIAPRTKLVTTKRKPRDLLSGVSSYVDNKLPCVNQNQREEFVTADIGHGPNLLLDPDFDLPENPADQRNVEFPHSRTNNSDFINFFCEPNHQR